MFVLPGLGTLGRIAGIFCFLSAFISVLTEQSNRALGPFQFTFGLFTLWAMMSFFWSIDQKQTLTSIITFIQLYVLILLVWEFVQSEQDQLALMNAYVLGAYVSVVGIVIAFTGGNQYQYMRYSASGFNPNDLGLILALGVPLAWRLTLEKKHTIVAWLYRLYIPSALVAITLTASRASFMAFCVAILFIIWTYTSLSLWQKCIVVLVFLMFGVSAFFVVPESSLSRITSIGDELLYGNLNQRTTIWMSGLEVFSGEPLLGTGAGTFRNSVATKLGRGVSSHNLFLSTLVGQGIIGFLILLSILVVLIISILEMPRLKRRLWTVMLATWFVGVMTLDWEQEKTTWLLLGLLACQGRIKVPDSSSRAQRDLPLQGGDVNIYPNR